MMVVLAMAIVVATTGPSGQAAGAPKYCQEVHARYAIYVNRDALWVIGSKHIIEVGITAIDKELEARGWEDTVAYGDFTICTGRKAMARSLTIKDEVIVTGYNNIRYVRR